MASAIPIDQNLINESPDQSLTLKLAFCLYKYFPHGGLQRDFLRIALACQTLNHEIRVYTLEWKGEVPPGFDVVVVPVTALTNHTRYERFSDWVQRALLQDPVDVVIGINKMPGLDIYYAADSCYAEKAHTQRSWLYRQLPRYKHFSQYEKAVFGRDSETEIMMISQVQLPFFDRYYQTQKERVHFLPPGISRDRIAPKNVATIHAEMRQELGVTESERMLLMIGSGFIKKGLKRALLGVRSLPLAERQRLRFFVIGEDNPAPFKRLANILGINRQLTILSGRDDVPKFLFAADLLILPALDEAAGIVLLESIVAGLPVLTTENCGYAHYVQDSGMGELITNPFQQKELNDRLGRMLNESDRTRWLGQSRSFAETADIYSLHTHAAAHVVRVAQNKRQSEKQRVGTIAFCLFKYFPYGGLQRDFLQIALKLQGKGFQIRVYTLLWQGDVPPGFDIIHVPVTALTNHSRYRKYHDWLSEHLKNFPVDKVVGFNKMPGLDVYYAADSCYEDKAQTQRSAAYRSLPRYKLFSAFEQAVFGEHSTTEILMIAAVQIPLFEKYYATQQSRFHLLTPGIARDRIAPPNRAEIRSAFRREMDVGEDDLIVLMIGSGFITKGLDRALIGLSVLPSEVLNRTRLMVIGQDAAGSFRRMAKRLNIADHLQIFKGRDDIPRFLLGADLLVHPAYVENTGTVLLEAIVAGLPVLATDVCGYAHYIEEAGAGMITPSPYRQETFNSQLQNMLTSDLRRSWSDNGLAFAKRADIYDMPDLAAKLICS